MAAGLIVTVAISAGGCGGQAQAPSASQTTKAEGARAESPYVEVLLGFRDAAEANAKYDAYGYFESGYAASQRAALDGFCLVVNEVRTSSESERLGDPAYFSRRVATAAWPEAEGASMKSIGRAIGKLQAIVKPESLTPALVKSYAKACY